MVLICWGDAVRNGRALRKIREHRSCQTRGIFEFATILQEEREAMSKFEFVLSRA